MSATTQPTDQEKSPPAQGKVRLPDVDQLTPQERLRLDTAVMVLVDYLVTASEQQPKESWIYAMISLMDYLTTQDAAEKLGISRQRVLALIHADRLPATKAGRDWLILPDDLESFKKRPQGNYKLTEDQSKLIRRLAQEGQPPEALAERFKVSIRTIYRHLNK